jgi:hypothetical protein
MWCCEDETVRTLAAANPILSPQVSDNDEIYMTEILDTLLEAKGVNVKVKDRHGNTPPLTASLNCTSITYNRPSHMGMFSQYFPFPSLDLSCCLSLSCN